MNTFLGSNKTTYDGYWGHGPAYTFGYNKYVLCNTTIPDYKLKKKLQNSAYHIVRKGVGSDEWRIANVNTHDNPADLLTKVIPMIDRWRGFVRMLQHHIFEPFSEATAVE